MLELDPVSSSTSRAQSDSGIGSLCRSSSQNSIDLQLSIDSEKGVLKNIEELKEHSEVSRSKSESNLSNIPYTSTPKDRSLSISSLNFPVSNIKPSVPNYINEESIVTQLPKDKDFPFVKPFTPEPKKSKLCPQLLENQEKAKKYRLHLQNIPIRLLMKPTNAFRGLLDHAEYLIPTIFKYLSPRDLISFSHVNRKLRLLITNSLSLNEKRMKFLDYAKKKFILLGKVKHLI